MLSSLTELLASGAAAVAALGGAPADGGTVRPHPIARVTAPVAVRAAPGGPAVGRLATRTRFGSPTIVPVLERRGRWLRVLAASRDRRPAWVRDSGRLEHRTTSVSITADLSAGRLVLRGARGSRSFAFRSGRPGSPTPTGTFAVTDRFDGSPFGGAYGCCVIALSGRQRRAPAGWDGGTRLAIHGRPGAGRPTPSAGCLVVGPAALRWLSRNAPLGAVVRIRA